MLVLDENSGLIQVTSRRKKGSFNDIARFRVHHASNSTLSIPKLDNYSFFRGDFGKVL